MNSSGNRLWAEREAAARQRGMGSMVSDSSTHSALYATVKVAHEAPCADKGTVDRRGLQPRSVRSPGFINVHDFPELRLNVLSAGVEIRYSVRIERVQTSWSSRSV